MDQAKDMKFYQLFQNKVISLNRINDYILEWHEGASEEPLYEFLGMTREQYVQWVRRRIVHDRKSKSSEFKNLRPHYRTKVSSV